MSCCPGLTTNSMRAGSVCLLLLLQVRLRHSVLCLTLRAIVRFLQSRKPEFSTNQPKPTSPASPSCWLHGAMITYHLPQKEACGPGFIRSGHRFALAIPAHWAHGIKIPALPLTCLATNCTSLTLFPHL